MSEQQGQARTDVPDGKDILITVTCDPALAAKDRQRKKTQAILIAVAIFVVAAIIIWAGASSENRLVYGFIGLVGLLGIMRTGVFSGPRKTAEQLRVERQRVRMGLPKTPPPPPVGYCDVTADTLYFSFRKPVPVADVTSASSFGSTLTLRRARQGYKAIHLRGVDHPKEFAELLTNLISTFDPRTGKQKA